jgi:phage/plasmid-like protein (TIGR03299 family)
MPDNIEVRNGQASMVYVGEVPWHKLGKRFDKRLTVTEALIESNARYLVEKWPMHYVDPHTPDLVAYEADDIFATVRTDTKDALGFVGKDYTIVQNEVAFNFLNPILDAKAGIIETLGVLGNGSTAWALIRLPEMIVISKKDEIGKYVLVFNGFNGKQKIRAKYTPIRVVCENTLNMALSGLDTEVAIRHTTNAEMALAEAHKVMGMANAVSKAIEPIYQRMALTKITDKQLLDYVAALIPIDEDSKRTTRKDNIRGEIMRLHEAGAGASFTRGTLWGAFNAVTEYVDHMYSGKSTPEQRLQAIWFGAGETLKINAFSEAVAVLKNA